MKRRTKIAIITTVALILYGMFVAWWLSPEPEREYRPFTQRELVEFRQRLLFHGLDRQVSIIYGWPENPWFERNGKRCSFYDRDKKL